MKRQFWLPLAVLALVVAAGAYVRLAHLGDADFGPGELYQVFAAQVLDAGGQPALPSGVPYDRGIDVTHLVDWSMDQFGSTPWAARLPAALFGVLNLILFAAVLWALGGPWVAVWGTLFLAIYPEAVSESRFLRFYTYQLVFGLVAFYAGWRALCLAGGREIRTRSGLLKQWLWTFATLLAFFLAARIQITTLSIMAGWGLCVVFAAAADVAVRGWKSWRSSIPLQLVGFGALGVLAALLVRPGLIAEVAARSQAVPYWVMAGGDRHPLAYYYLLSENFPVMVSLSPLIFLVVAVRSPKLAVYLAAWFMVPLALHSFVFPWKGARFVFLAMPALFTAAAIAATVGAGALYRWTRRVLTEVQLRRSVHRPLAYGVVAITSLALVVTTPAFNEARKAPGSGQFPGWSGTAEVIREHPELGDVPKGHAWPLHGLYYMDGLDFVVRTSALEESLGRFEDGEWSAEWKSIGSADRESGRPVFTTPEAIRDRYADQGAVLVGLDMRYVENGIVRRDLYNTLAAEAQELCQGRCGTLRLYYWRFGPEQNRSGKPRALAYPRGGEVSESSSLN